MSISAPAVTSSLEYIMKKLFKLFDSIKFYYLVISDPAFVGLCTIFVKPMPNCGIRKSLSAVNAVGINSDIWSNFQKWFPGPP